MAAKDLCVATTHPAERSPRTNDVDRTPVDASYSGVGFAILAEPWRLLPHAVGHWLPSLQFLASSRCTIEIANTYTVCPDGSIVLMEDAMLGDFTNGEIRVNRCRLFLQVECLSDVCTADGLTTDPGLQTSATSPHRARSSGLVKGFQGLARGQYGGGS
jgi:hypothetical protein